MCECHTKYLDFAPLGRNPGGFCVRHKRGNKMGYLNKNLLIEVKGGDRHSGSCVSEDHGGLVLREHMKDGSVEHNKYLFDNMVFCMERYA